MDFQQVLTTTDCWEMAFAAQQQQSSDFSLDNITSVKGAQEPPCIYETVDPSPDLSSKGDKTENPLHDGPNIKANSMSAHDAGLFSIGKDQVRFEAMGVCKR